MMAEGACMDKRWTVAIVTVAVAGSVVLGASPPQAATGIDQLAWMAGCWTGGGGGRQVDEQWMKPLGGTMMGMSRTVSGGRTVESETLMIRQTGAEVAYVARPSNQPEASFTMTAGSATEVRFENPAHDFPQRIIYRLQPDGSLHARIEGTRDGKVRGIDFPMKRGECR
jgi:hypothetical protein